MHFSVAAAMAANSTAAGSDGCAGVLASDEAPTLKSCRKLLEAIATALKTKWKYERQMGQPQLKTANATGSGCKTSASNKKLLKSLAKYETYIMKTLWSRWAIFEKKTERVRDAEERQKVLRATYTFFERMLHETTEQATVSSGGNVAASGKPAVLPVARGTKRSNGSGAAGKATRKCSPLTATTTLMTTTATLQRRGDTTSQPAHQQQATFECIGNNSAVSSAQDGSGNLMNIFISSTYKIDSIADMLQEEVEHEDCIADDEDLMVGLEYGPQVSASTNSLSMLPQTAPATMLAPMTTMCQQHAHAAGGNAADDGLLCMTVFEPPHPSTSIASAQATTRYFKVQLVYLVSFIVNCNYFFGSYYTGHQHGRHGGNNTTPVKATKAANAIHCHQQIPTDPRSSIRHQCCHHRSHMHSKSTARRCCAGPRRRQSALALRQAQSSRTRRSDVQRSARQSARASGRLSDWQGQLGPHGVRIRCGLCADRPETAHAVRQRGCGALRWHSAGARGVREIHVRPAIGASAGVDRCAGHVRLYLLLCAAVRFQFGRVCGFAGGLECGADARCGAGRGDNAASGTRTGCIAFGEATDCAWESEAEQCAGDRRGCGEIGRVWHIDGECKLEIREKSLDRQCRIFTSYLNEPQYLYDEPEDICAQDKIWWAEEIHTWFKVLNTFSCSTMSDIYVGSVPSNIF